MDPEGPGKSLQGACIGPSPIPANTVRSNPDDIILPLRIVVGLSGWGARQPQQNPPKRLLE